MELKKKTSLEKSEDVKDTLNWKLTRIQEANMPMESGIADYIALAIQNLEHEIEYIKEIEGNYKEKREEISKQIEQIKIEGANFFNDVGIVKVDGVICSSITLTKQKDSITTETSKKVFKTSLSQAEIEELLLGLGKAEIVTVIEEKTSKAIPAKLKINKRKSNVPKS